MKYFSIYDLLRIMTYWFMKEETLLAESLSEGRMLLEKELDANGEFHNLSYLGLALSAAAEGNAEQSERQIRNWQRLADWSDRAGRRHLACRILAMADITDATVACIRIGLKEPSWIMPFLEPHLPYYDSLRDEPAFKDLLANIEQKSRTANRH